MLDYQRIVDDVRSALLWQDADNLDFLRSAAADFLVACDETNDRLRRCGALLKQGLRSEAIRLCEVEPNLLDTVATLDFPEREQWNGLVAQYGIVAPPPLMLEWASVLNEAYALEQPLADLLRRHRLAALARGPLPVRIGLLRKLAECDADNPAWQEDLTVFERERQKELAGEIAEAQQAANLHRLISLEDEIRDGGWSSPPPAQLVQRAFAARTTLEQRETRAELESLNRQLHDALASFDVETGRALREQWKPRAHACGLSDSEPLFQQAMPALEWLAEQDQLAAQQAVHDSAVAGLERSLDSNQPAEELIVRYNVAKKTGFPLPDYVVNRYRTRLENLRQVTKRRRVLIASGIGAGTLLVAALVTLIVLYNVHESEVAHQAAEFTKLLNTNDISGAQVFLDGLKHRAPGIADSEQITALAVRLRTLVQDDTERHTAFVAAVAKANESLPGPDGLETKTPDRDALQEAARLASTKAERADLAKVEASFKQVDRDYQARTDRKFVADLAALNAAISALASQVADDPKSTSSQIDALRKTLDGLKPRCELVSAELDADAGIEAARGHLNGIISSLKELQTERDAEDGLTDAIGKPGAYQAAVAQFVERCGSSPRAHDFRAIQSEAPLWIGVEQWDEFIQQWGHKDASGLSPQDAAKYLDAANALLKDYGDYPDAELVHKRLPFLEAIKRRLDGDQQPIQGSLRKLFSDPLVASIWMVQLQGGDRYYTQANPGFVQAVSPFSYIADFSMKEAKKSGGIKVADVVYNENAPQMKLADSVKQVLNHLEDSNWEASFFQIVKLICARDNNIEPLLKLNLLQQTLDVGCRGSECLSLAFADLSAKVKESNVDPAANWLDPNDKSAHENRERAEKVLKDFEDLASVGKAAGDRFQSLRKPLGHVLRWVGWLRKGQAGQWQCVVPATRGESGDLFVMVGQLGHGAKLEPIGAVQQGVQSIRSADDSTLVEGRPVYFLPPSSPTGTATATKE